MKRIRVKNQPKNRAKNPQRKKLPKKNRSGQGSVQNLINFILEFRILKYTPRASLPYFKNSVKENIAEHSFYTTIIGWVLAGMAKADADKVIKMCLIHDLTEVRFKNLTQQYG